MINISDLSYIDKIPQETLIPLSNCLSYSDSVSGQVKGMGAVIIALLFLIGYLLYERYKEIK